MHLLLASSLLVSAFFADPWPQIPGTGQRVKLVLRGETLDSLDAWDGGEFTAPTPGIYTFRVNIRVQNVVSTPTTVMLVLVAIPVGECVGACSEGYRFEAERGLIVTADAPLPDYGGTAVLEKSIFLEAGDRVQLHAAASSHTVLSHPEHTSWLQIYWE